MQISSMVDRVSRLRTVRQTPTHAREEPLGNGTKCGALRPAGLSLRQWTV